MSDTNPDSHATGHVDYDPASRVPAAAAEPIANSATWTYLAREYLLTRGTNTVILATVAQRSRDWSWSANVKFEGGLVPNGKAPTRDGAMLLAMQHVALFLRTADLGLLSLERRTPLVVLSLDHINRLYAARGAEIAVRCGAHRLVIYGSHPSAPKTHDSDHVVGLRNTHITDLINRKVLLVPANAPYDFQQYQLVAGVGNIPTYVEG